VNESVSAAAVRLDEAIAFGVVEKFHSADRHLDFLSWEPEGGFLRARSATEKEKGAAKRQKPSICD
jgi:hypothetical protein